MNVPGAGGGSAPGPSTALPRAPGRAGPPAGCCECRPGAPRAGRKRLVPLRHHIRRAVPHSALDRVDRQATRSWSPWGRWPPAPARDPNNPASAATRAVDALQATCAALVSSWAGSPDELSAAQFTALEELRRELEPGARTRTRWPGPTARRRSRSGWPAHGVSGTWAIAPPLAAPAPTRLVPAGRCRPGRASPPAGPGVDGRHRLVRRPARGGQGVDRRVRSWSPRSVLLAAGPLLAAAVDVTDGLDSTLVMLGHKLGGVTVLRSTAPASPIEAYLESSTGSGPDLIDNAVDAMDRLGHAAAGHRAEGDSVVVRSATPARDAAGGGGPRLRALLHHQGGEQGTGLGLDIARRIVEERHGAHRHRLPAGPDRAVGPPPGPALGEESGTAAPGLSSPRSRGMVMAFDRPRRVAWPLWLLERAQVMDSLQMRGLRRQDAAPAIVVDEPAHEPPPRPRGRAAPPARRPGPVVAPGRGGRHQQFTEISGAITRCTMTRWPPGISRGDRRPGRGDRHHPQRGGGRRHPAQDVFLNVNWDFRAPRSARRRDPGTSRWYDDKPVTTLRTVTRQDGDRGLEGHGGLLHHDLTGVGGRQVLGARGPLGAGGGRRRSGSTGLRGR